MDTAQSPAVPENLAAVDRGGLLTRQNDCDVALALTVAGSAYVLKAHAENSKGHRQTLINVLMGCMLRRHGKSEATFLDVVQPFLSRGSPCALLRARNLLRGRPPARSQGAGIGSTFQS